MPDQNTMEMPQTLQTPQMPPVRLGKRMMARTHRSTILNNRIPVLSSSRPKATKTNKTQISPRDLERSLCLKSFYDFFLRFWPVVCTEKLVDNWHIQYLCNELQVVAERVFERKPKLYDLIINISPGTTKSLIGSVLFPAWCWARQADFRFINASYALDLSFLLSGQTRRAVASEKYQSLFPEVKLTSDSLGLLMTEKNGQRIACAVGGRIMGMHGHIIVIDDPINPKEACTQAGLNEAIRWFDNTIPFRMVNKSVTPMILIMQRLAQLDPTGYMLHQRRNTPCEDPQAGCRHSSGGVCHRSCFAVVHRPHESPESSEPFSECYWKLKDRSLEYPGSGFYTGPASHNGGLSAAFPA